MKHETVTIRAKPTAADLRKLMDTARGTVADIAKADGALGHEAIAELYVRRIYDAIVGRAIKLRRKATK